MPPPDYTIGLDIGGTSLKSACVTRDGQILTRGTVPLDPADSNWPGRVCGRLRELESEAGRPAAAVGVAAPGIAAPDGRSIWWMQGRLGEVQGLDWAAFLDRPRVPVLNDAQAALLGEAWLGAAAGARNVILLTLGTGVGGAAMVDGRLLKGHLGRAGHLGHVSLDPGGPPDIVGTPGSLEDAVGNCTVGSRTGGRFESTLRAGRRPHRGRRRGVRRVAPLGPGTGGRGRVASQRARPRNRPDRRRHRSRRAGAVRTAAKIAGPNGVASPRPPRPRRAGDAGRICRRDRRREERNVGATPASPGRRPMRPS